MLTNITNKNLIEKTYVKLSPIEHVLKKPSMYIGDLDFRKEKQPEKQSIFKRLFGG